MTGRRFSADWAKDNERRAAGQRAASAAYSVRCHSSVSRRGENIKLTVRCSVLSESEKAKISTDVLESDSKTDPSKRGQIDRSAGS
jgi:hypothetical protein